MQVVKLLPHVMRRPAFDETRDISWQRVRVGRKEQMDMVGLNGQSLNVPMLLLCHFFDDLLQTICNWPDQNLPPSLGAENDVVQDMVDRMLLMNVPRSIHSQESLPFYEKLGKQPWHPFRFEVPYATRVLSIERPGRNRHYRGGQTESRENRQIAPLLKEQKQASGAHQHPFSCLHLDYGVLRRPPESNCKIATRIQAPMKAMITLPQK